MYWCNQYLLSAHCVPGTVSCTVVVVVNKWKTSSLWGLHSNGGKTDVQRINKYHKQRSKSKGSKCYREKKSRGGGRKHWRSVFRQRRELPTGLSRRPHQDDGIATKTWRKQACYPHQRLRFLKIRLEIFIVQVKGMETRIQQRFIIEGFSWLPVHQEVGVEWAENGGDPATVAISRLLYSVLGTTLLEHCRGPQPRCSEMWKLCPWEQMGNLERLLLHHT